MKPELVYQDYVTGSLIEDYISDIEWNIKLCPLSDPYFEQLSLTKFALEEMLREISESNGPISSRDIIERFARRMDRYACEKLSTSYIFSVAHDTAQGILDETIF